MLFWCHSKISGRVLLAELSTWKVSNDDRNCLPWQKHNELKNKCLKTWRIKVKTRMMGFEGDQLMKRRCEPMEMIKEWSWWKKEEGRWCKDEDDRKKDERKINGALDCFDCVGEYVPKGLVSPCDETKRLLIGNVCCAKAVLTIIQCVVGDHYLRIYDHYQIIARVVWCHNIR